MKWMDHLEYTVVSKSCPVLEEFYMPVLQLWATPAVLTDFHLSSGMDSLLALLANFTKFQHSGQPHKPEIFINPLDKKMKNK